MPAVQSKPADFSACSYHEIIVSSKQPSRGDPVNRVMVSFSRQSSQEEASFSDLVLSCTKSRWMHTALPWVHLHSDGRQQFLERRVWWSPELTPFLCMLLWIIVSRQPSRGRPREQSQSSPPQSGRRVGKGEGEGGCKNSCAPCHDCPLVFPPSPQNTVIVQFSWCRC
jgi:hypothetical protein